jgi:uncharacterized damage-inducible protein DinB
MSELEQILVGDGAAAAPHVILQGIEGGFAHRRIEGAPHTIYEELWHIAFWQQITLDWVRGLETPIPQHAAAGFPGQSDLAREDWDELCRRFFNLCEQAVESMRDETRLEQAIRCPSRPGLPVRVMTVREQMENLAAHNAYHFGRVVLLRQLLGIWPPRSGGFTW